MKDGGLPLLTSSVTRSTSDARTRPFLPVLASERHSRSAADVEIGGAEARGVFQRDDEGFDHLGAAGAGEGHALVAHVLAGPAELVALAEP